jgi:hypothetical protein
MRKTLCKIGTFLTTVILFWVLLLEETTNPGYEWKKRKRLFAPFYEMRLEGWELLGILGLGLVGHLCVLALVFGAFLLVYNVHIWLLLVIAAVASLYWLVRLSYECAKANNTND